MTARNMIAIMMAERTVANEEPEIVR